MSIPKDISLDHVQASIFSPLNQPFPHLEIKMQKKHSLLHYKIRFDEHFCNTKKSQCRTTKKQTKKRTTVAEEKERQHSGKISRAFRF